jgi:hypothetical protein
VTGICSCCAWSCLASPRCGWSGNKDLVTQLKTEQSCYEGKLEAIVEKGRESRERLVLSLDRNTGVLERVEKRLDAAKA